MTQTTTQPMTAGLPAVSNHRAMARIPILGELGALVRFFRDRDASLLGKAFVVATIAYVVMPADVVPDLAPLVGWLDDLGLVVVAMTYLSRVLGPYRK